MHRYSVFARSRLTLPQTPFSRSLRSICDPGHPHPMRTLQITNGGPERARKQSLGEREGGDRTNTVPYMQVSERRTTLKVHLFSQINS